jgi:hypothetical protein
LDALADSTADSKRTRAIANDLRFVAGQKVEPTTLRHYRANKEALFGELIEQLVEIAETPLPRISFIEHPGLPTGGVSEPRRALDAANPVDELRRALRRAGGDL